MSLRHVVLSTLSLLDVACSSCDPADDTALPHDTGDTAAADTTPAIRIVDPAPESRVTGCANIIVEVDNFTVVDFETHTQNVAGEGHYHVISDDGYVPCIELSCLVTLQTEGFQSITAQLMNNDHSPYADGDGQTVEDVVLLDVTSGACAE